MTFMETLVHVPKSNMPVTASGFSDTIVVVEPTDPFNFQKKWKSMK